MKTNTIATKAKHMTASELKYHYQLANPNGHFFDRKTMRFFGDTMGNYGVRANTVNVKEFDGNVVECYVLYRRRATKHGLTKDAYFSVSDFSKILGEVL